MGHRLLLGLLFLTLGVFPAVAQGALPPLPGSRITDGGVVRAGAAIDSVFVQRTRLSDTVNIGDFTAQLLARIGAPPFGDSLLFRVNSDTQLVRVAGRLTDFPADVRADLRPIFAFLDSTSVFVAELSMPEHDHGIMRFRLERVTIRGVPIPDLLLAPALQEYTRLYPSLLASGGREFLVAMPPEGTATLVRNGIVLTMPPKP